MVPVPPLVVTLGMDALGPEMVKPNVASPPTAVLSIRILPWAVLLKVQVTLPPTGTVTLAGEPPPQLELVRAQLA